MRKGIIAGGNWIIDRIKIIDKYPAQDALANILSESSSNGGSPYNILKDLSLLGAPFPLQGVGLVGNDANGSFIRMECNALGIDTTLLLSHEGASTSYTDVMTVESTGRRTFFHQRGTNALLDIGHFNLSNSHAKIFHLGYLLLLDKLDDIAGDGRTGASHLFEEAILQGFKISADVVSESSDRFAGVVTPSLPFIDYLFVNEYEAGKITGINLHGPNGNVDIEMARKSSRKLLEMGVREWVILHFPEGSVAAGKNGNMVSQGSVTVPQNEIKGAVGAGDAFASGVLFGLHENWPMEDCLLLGVSTAATCLHRPSCSEGIRPYAQATAYGREKGFRVL